MTGLEDLHGVVHDENQTGYHEFCGGDDDLLGVSTNPSMFFAEFPTLPDFNTCMSSSSSSSSPPQQVQLVGYACSSSSATSSSVHNSEAESYHHFKGQHAHLAAQAAALSSTASMEVQHGSTECMDMLENFGYMDLLDRNDFFDPSSMLNTGGFEQDEDISPLETHQFLQENMQEEDGSQCMQKTDDSNFFGVCGFRDDMAEVFFEWLKSNKGAVSADDLRKVRIKKATVESAARNLGGGREAMKQLLRLILQWVQSNIQKTRIREAAVEGFQQFRCNSLQEPASVISTNVKFNSIQPDSSPCVTQPLYPVDRPGIMVHAYQPVGYVEDSCSNSNTYQQSDSNYNWFPDNGFPRLTSQTPQAFGGYGSRYPFGQYGENGPTRLGSSASKEARKKRMAKQRRMMSHHRHHNQQNQQQGLPSEHCGLLGSDNRTVVPPQTNHGNWMYWQQLPVGGVTRPGMIPIDTAQARQVAQSYQLQVVAQEPRQGWKSEKNLKFLLQKVLKQSDVGSLGRIVLPKKEAEIHLPELDARDGINIAMEDIGISRVWNMKYRFWPNNKSRMYLLENTGDFVKANGLQEGDFIVIYSDLKCGKYMIRGVKVRPHVKTDNRSKAGKAQKTKYLSSPIGDLSSAISISQNQ